MIQLVPIMPKVIGAILRDWMCGEMDGYCLGGRQDVRVSSFVELELSVGGAASEGPRDEVMM